MIIGHLPAGYLLGRMGSRLRVVDHASRRDLVAACMMGAIFPDVDMIWFHLVDHGRIHHHLYWTHLPAFWLLVAAAIALAGTASPRLRARAAFWFFLLGVLSHLVLDSLIGDIYWALPFAHEPFSLFQVQARHSPWYLNFILHWVFALECALLLIAGTVAAGDFRRHRARLHPRHL